MLDFGTSTTVNFVPEVTVSLFIIDGVSDNTGVRSFSVGGIPVSSVLGQSLPGMSVTGAVTRFAITDGLGANGGAPTSNVATIRLTAPARVFIDHSWPSVVPPTYGEIFPHGSFLDTGR